MAVSTDTPMEPVKGHTALAWVAVLAIAAVGLLIIVVSAFSQDNVRTSVDGDRSVDSQYFDEG